MDGAWILLGMMGAGKTTIGRNLAERLDVPFLDSDRMLEHRLGRPIHQLFGLYGEEAFRGHETSIFRSLERSPAILSTGGGAILRDENWKEFKRLGVTIFLDVPPDRLKKRLVASKRRRPLLEVEGWEQRFDELYQSRIERYRTADITMAVAEEPMDQIVNQLERVIKEWKYA